MYNAYIKGGGGGAPCPPCPTNGKWTRPADWLTIPSIGASEQVCYFLFLATDTSSNYVAFRFTGAYTVDWGDGSSTENVASNTTAQYNFDFATLSNEITHKGVTYRQALIKVIPQPANNLTVFNNTFAHAGISTTNRFKVVEMVISMPNATSIATGSSAPKFIFCEHFDFRNVGTLTTFASIIQGYSLNKLSIATPPTNVSNLTFFTYKNRATLDIDDNINYNIVSNLSSAFRESNINDTAFDKEMSALTLLTSAWQTNISIKKVHISNSSLLTHINFSFNNASNIHDINIADASALTDTTNAFAGCNSLQKLILGGITIGFGINGCLLGATELNAMFTALGTASGSQTIDVRNNPGSATCDPTIATAKGWTITT
jgi:hypothetical protein